MGIFKDDGGRKREEATFNINVNQKFMTRDWGNKKRRKMINVDKLKRFETLNCYQENILTYYDGLEVVVKVLIVLFWGPDCKLDLSNDDIKIAISDIEKVFDLLLKLTGPGSSKQLDDSVLLVASSSRLTVSLSEFRLSYSSDSVLNFFDFFRGLWPVPRLTPPLEDRCFFDISIVSRDS